MSQVAGMNTSISPGLLKEITAAQWQFYHEKGYLHLPAIFDMSEVERMREGLDRIIQDWAVTGTGWKSQSGPYANSDQSQVIVVQRLEHYSSAWETAKHSPRLVRVAADLLGPDVEYFGSSTHSKPARTGGSFPLHQDSLFYDHEDPRLLICMVHLDDSSEKNGAIAFLPGFLRQHLPHTIERDPEQGGPYLPPDQYRIDDATPVCCRAGDVVIFNQYTIHGSKPNPSDAARRAVVFRYRHPDNRPTHEGRHRPLADDRPVMGTMVAGSRPPRPGYCAPPGGDSSRPAPRGWFSQLSA